MHVYSDIIFGIYIICTFLLDGVAAEMATRRRRKRKRKRGGGYESDIKCNNPHLTGGEHSKGLEDDDVDDDDDDDDDVLFHISVYFFSNSSI